MMESGFLTLVLAFSIAVYSSHADITEWEDIVVARWGVQTTLLCTDRAARGGVTINWKVSVGTHDWQLLLSVSEGTKFSGGALKPSMRFTDPNFENSGNFSLSFTPEEGDGGLYSCLIERQGRKQKERVILLVLLTVIISPAPPVPQNSTMRLIAILRPNVSITWITWIAPGSITMRSEKMPETVTKMPQVQMSDSGSYVCMVQTWSNTKMNLFPFHVEVTVDADKVASFTNIGHGQLISTATRAQTSFPLTCPGVRGDLVMLHWEPPGKGRKTVRKLVYKYDRWRGSTVLTEQSKKLQLAGPPYNAEAGSFSFLLTPELGDGGLYICEVLLNDNIFSQETRLSVLKVKTNSHPSKLELWCMYTELSQVQSATWKHHNISRQLSSGPGRIFIILPLPITSHTAGNYTCTLQLKNGQVIWATQTVTLHPKESVSVTTPSLLPLLSALLLLVPLVAAAAGVLLWRQKHISDHGIEQSGSVHSCEAENIYEYPEDVRQQAPSQDSVYMDLKPRGEDDVYKELERCGPCQS